MNILKKSAIVPYSAKQMFELVNNIPDYPHFLPWCSESQVNQVSEGELIATLNITWKGIHKNFTTRNCLHPYERMEIHLENGPLKHLEGIWHFTALNEKACKVTLDMEFAFAGHLIDKLFEPIFQQITNTFVDAFCKRAKEVYGNE